MEKMELVLVPEPFVGIVRRLVKSLHKGNQISLRGRVGEKTALVCSYILTNLPEHVEVHSHMQGVGLDAPVQQQSVDGESQRSAERAQLYALRVDREERAPAPAPDSLTTAVVDNARRELANIIRSLAGIPGPLIPDFKLPPLNFPPNPNPNLNPRKEPND